LAEQAQELLLAQRARRRAAVLGHLEREARRVLVFLLLRAARDEDGSDRARAQRTQNVEAAEDAARREPRRKRRLLRRRGSEAVASLGLAAAFGRQAHDARERDGRDLGERRR